MSTDSKDFLSNIPMLEQRQDSLQDQLDDLYAVALRLGMRDAVDWLREKGIHMNSVNLTDELRNNSKI